MLYVPSFMSSRGGGSVAGSRCTTRSEVMDSFDQHPMHPVQRHHRHHRHRKKHGKSSQDQDSSVDDIQHEYFTNESDVESHDRLKLSHMNVADTQQEGGGGGGGGGGGSGGGGAGATGHSKSSKSRFVSKLTSKFTRRKKRISDQKRAALVKNSTTFPPLIGGLNLHSLIHPETEFRVLWQKQQSNPQSGSFSEENCTWVRQNSTSKQVSAGGALSGGAAGAGVAGGCGGSSGRMQYVAEVHDCQRMACQRVTLNVSGALYEIRLGLLNQHPRTLLGNPWKRQHHFDAARKEYFFDRHRPTFEAIFNYYQYGGRLKRPPQVPDDIFLLELEFFEIEQHVIDEYKREEGYITHTITLPEEQWKRSVWMLFEYPETSPFAFVIATSSVLFTLVSIVLFCVETLPHFSESHCDEGAAPNFMDQFFLLESVCTLWFTLELVIRFIACPSKKKFLVDLRNHIDVAAVLPYYITLGNVLITFSCEKAKSSASLAFLRVIRLIRVFKLTKHSPGLQVLLLTFRASLEGLCLFLVALFVCILVFSSTIYYAEMGVQGSDIESIPDAFWWAIITICTVGYGDKVPRGPLGKLVGGVCAVAGVLTLAIPVPILTENFNKFYAHRKSRDRG